MVIRKFGVGDLLRDDKPAKKTAAKKLTPEEVAAIQAEGDERTPRS